MDWMTALIEVIGAAIFCIWVVIPIGEYRSIYRRFREARRAVSDDVNGHGFPVIPKEPHE